MTEVAAVAGGVALVVTVVVHAGVELVKRHKVKAARRRIFGVR